MNGLTSRASQHYKRWNKPRKWSAPIASTSATRSAYALVCDACICVYASCIALRLLLPVRITYTSKKS